MSISTDRGAEQLSDSVPITIWTVSGMTLSAQTSNCPALVRTGDAGGFGADVAWWVIAHAAWALAAAIGAATGHAV